MVACRYFWWQGCSSEVCMRIYLIRHGDPDYSTDSLTKDGQAEASALADYMASLRAIGSLVPHGAAPEPHPTLNPSWIVSRGVDRLPSCL